MVNPFADFPRNPSFYIQAGGSQILWTSNWVNGSVVVTNTGMTFKGTDKSYTYTYVGKSSYADAYLGAQIYFLNVYNRALSDAEAAANY